MMPEPGAMSLNPLATAGQSPAPAGGPMQAIQADHDFAKAQFTQLSKARASMDKVRSALDGLSKLGDTVSPDDVIEASGKLVASGMDPVKIASLLADMPSNGGEALAAWVGQHAAGSMAKEKQIDQALAVARHELGVSALRELALHHVQQPPPGAVPAGMSAASSGVSSPPDNALAPAGNPAGNGAL